MKLASIFSAPLAKTQKRHISATGSIVQLSLSVEFGLPMLMWPPDLSQAQQKNLLDHLAA
ncbi:hypothetical protein [Qipengyuania sp. DGS5-3]|uniref:hypothetical protein n=1 Tax=Qipengyuania sp. DGS5-3 TaxID=3349632 RepID=UPI0036D3458C